MSYIELQPTNQPVNDLARATTTNQPVSYLELQQPASQPASSNTRKWQCDSGEFVISFPPQDKRARNGQPKHNACLSSSRSLPTI